MRNGTSWSRFEAQKRLASVDLTLQTLPWTTEPLVLISSSWGSGDGGGEWCWLFSAATAVGNGNCGDSVMVMVSQWWWLGEQWRSNRVVDTCYSGYIRDTIIAPKIQPSQDLICLTRTY